MKLGIVGLPNVGKSTLFNAITKAGADCANYPFCTIEPNVGIVRVPDKRVDRLAEIYHPKNAIHTTIEFVDIAGLVKGASRGEGLGNKFLSNIREVDAIVHVVRAFDDNSIVHVDGQVDPKRDIETINLELVFADLETVEKRMEKTRKMMKSGDRKYQAELALQEKIKSHLEKGMPVRSMSFDEDEAAYVRQLFLLTSKPVLYCANVDEEALSDIDSNLYVRTVRAMAEAENSESVVICARIEEEIAQLDDDERKLFLRELGLEESGLDKLVRASYKLLGLISFLTIGDDEVRAWTIVKGTKAPQAAGKVHSDFEKGFIRAEVVAFDDLMRCGSYAAAREQGLVRSEGRDYVMKDGDVALFRFNV